ncbi:hypothetical protein GZH53_03545 [Flavihumibacter sp. R14]|nr:hypothetical protein [Flavihumibacter soli]
MFNSRLHINPGENIPKIVILAIFILCCSQKLLAQRFNFTQYNIEDGLIQSQVRALAQSPSHHLWIATQGGISRFDGTQFHSLTRSENGLAGMVITSVVSDNKGRIFIGTQNGLSVHDGENIRNYRVPLTTDEGKQESYIHGLIKEKHGRIYGLINDKAFVFAENKIQLVKPVAFSDSSVTALTTDHAGNVYAAVYGKGIYSLKGNIWKQEFSDTARSLKIRQIMFDRNNPNDLWVLTHQNIFIVENKKRKPFKNSILDASSNFFLSIEQDKKSNIWLGTVSGAYCISPRKTTFFNSRNGFTDNAINQIFRDAEDNIWFATEGAGIYKYDGDKTMILDKGQGLDNEIVMGFAMDRKGEMLIQSFGNGMVKREKDKLNRVKLPLPDSVPYRIGHIYNDKDRNVWIGTFGTGLWMYDGERFKNFPYREGKIPRVIRYIIQDRDGAIWLATPTGCYIYKSGTFTHIANFDHPTASLLEIGADSILANTGDGNFLITGKGRRIDSIARKELMNTDIYAWIKYKNKVVIGTGEYGIFIWDLRNNSFKNLKRNNGLYSNTIYSLIADKEGFIWAGTGRGINKISFDEATDSYRIRGAEYSRRMVVECNQHAMFIDNQNKLWVGTTKGALIFDLGSQSVVKERPHIVLQSVKLYSSIIKKQKQYFSSTDGFSLPRDLQLAYSKNHISVNFKGIYLTGPSDVMYQYRLIGLDDTFSNPTSNSSVNYQALAPGDYVFEARALTPLGIISDNVIKFPFTIRPAFYQTLTFRFAVIMLFVLAAIALQAYLHKRKTQQLQLIENLKRDERLKARQQTAEDFHDDLGNKLTRISILSDILNTKLNGEHQEEKHLIHQIKENASSLYRGTKDILWALDPKSDNLFEIMCHISEFGIDLFQDTPIVFNINGVKEHLSAVKFPMEYSRNVSMIFKESLNNILRHSEADLVDLTVAESEHIVQINLTDNGKGFDENEVNKGHGLKNITLRANRIGAQLTIDASKGKGSAIRLIINKT